MDSERGLSYPWRVGPKKPKKKVKATERGHQGQGLWGGHISQEPKFPLLSSQYHWLFGQEQFHSGEVNRRQRKG